MPRIATLTLNPALDVTTGVDKVLPTHKLRCGKPRFDPGGGGINVARVIHKLGGDAAAIFPQGGPAGATIEALLREAGVPIATVAIAGATRESLTVDEAETGLQYRFVLPGPELSAAEQKQLFETLENLSPAPGFVVASGSLPPGADPALYARLADHCRAIGVSLIVDTSGPALAACEGSRVRLLKPSLHELRDLLDRPIEGEAEEESAARALIDRDFAEAVVLSLGERGALLVTRETVKRYPAIKVETRSAVGAGDSMVAAITLALSRGDRIEDAVRFGIAAGAATLMTPATELARRADVERLYAEASASA